MRFRITHPETAGKQVNEMLDVRLTEDDEFLYMSLRGTDPVRTVAVLNTLGDRFVAELQTLPWMEPAERSQVMVTSPATVPGHGTGAGQLRFAAIGIGISTLVAGKGAGFKWQPDRASLTPKRKVDFSVSTFRAASHVLDDHLDAHLSDDARSMVVTLRGPSSARVGAVLNTIADRFVSVSRSSRWFAGDTSQIRVLSPATVPAKASRLGQLRAFGIGLAVSAVLSLLVLVVFRPVARAPRSAGLHGAIRRQFRSTIRRQRFRFLISERFAARGKASGPAWLCHKQMDSVAARAGDIPALPAPASTQLPGPENV